jgi:peptide deformylase
MAILPIRTFGDPVLRQRASEVVEIDGKIASLCNDMLATMYDAPGVGLAAPQVGILKRLFVYDIGDGPQVMVNPEVHETDGEFEYDEGCLSIPGMSIPIVRADRVHVVGRDLDGNEVDFEAEELFGRVVLHELDHLDGVLMLDRLEPDQRKKVMRELRRMADLATLIGPDSPDSPNGGGGHTAPAATKPAFGLG